MCKYCTIHRKNLSIWKVWRLPGDGTNAPQIPKEVCICTCIVYSNNLQVYVLCLDRENGIHFLCRCNKQAGAGPPLIQFKVHLPLNCNRGHWSWLPVKISAFWRERSYFRPPLWAYHTTRAIETDTVRFERLLSRDVRAADICCTDTMSAKLSREECFSNPTGWSFIPRILHWSVLSC